MSLTTHRVWVSLGAGILLGIYLTLSFTHYTSTGVGLLPLPPHAPLVKIAATESAATESNTKLHNVHNVTTASRENHSKLQLHNINVDRELAQARTLDDKERADLRQLELAEYGSQVVDMSFKTRFTQPPVRFLPNYKNPCWYSAEGTSSSLKCVPYFLVPGVAKCGTTLLFEILKRHHQIVPSNVKEFPTFLHAYKNIFSKATYKIARTVVKQPVSSKIDWFHPLITYDSTPSNLVRLETANYKDHEITDTKAYVIKKFFPSAKIIIIIRDPTIRTYSDYNHFVHKSPAHFHNYVVAGINAWKKCMDKTSNRNYCAYSNIDRRKAPIGMSVYDVFIADWMEVLGRENFLIIQTEEYKRETRQTLTRIFDFLDLEPMKESVLAGIDTKKEDINRRNYKTGPMWNKTKTLLDDFYRPHLKQLSQLLGDNKWMWGH